MNDNANGQQNDAKGNLKEKFKTAIETNDQNSVMEALREMFINAIELKIDTTVTENPGEKRIVTTVNLLEGDITTRIHASFMPDPKEVAQFHQEQVNKAEKIIETNINTLQTLTKVIMQLFV